MADNTLAKRSGKTPKQPHPLDEFNLDEPRDYDAASDALATIVHRKEFDPEERAAFTYLIQRMRHFAEKQAGVNAAIWLTEAEWEIVKQTWFRLEALVVLLKEADDPVSLVCRLVECILDPFVCLCSDELDGRVMTTVEDDADEKGGAA